MNQALNRLLQENKTAFYVFDIEKLKARIAHLQAALPPEVVLCYAVKANTFITKELIDTIHRFEVCSPGEAEICRAVGVPSENMVISGVYKTPEVMEAMVADLDFSPIYTVESLEQYELFRRLAKQYGRTLPLLLRLTNGSQFGINKGDIEAIVARRGETPEVDILGIQFFSGTQKTSLKKLKREVGKLDDLLTLLEEKYGKIKPGKREQKLIAACEKLGYCVQITKPGRAALQEMARTWAGEYHTTFAPGAEAALLDRCGDDQFLLQNEIAKLAALSGYTTITTQMIQQLGTVTLDADTFDMVKLVAAGNTRQALAKLQTLLELQNEPILITGALIGNYLDIYRAFLAKKSRRPLADLAKDFKYTGKWNYRLGNADQTAARFQRSQIEESLRILQKLDLDLKGSRLDAPLLMQKAICELSLARSRA